MTASKDRLTIAVIGCGHWGPNHIRVFSELDRCQVVACADTNPKRLQCITSRHPAITATTDYRRLLDDPAIDAVVVSTPTETHDFITREALLAGKHVLVEKPMCTTVDQACQLTETAAACHRVLMVGHIFLFNDGIIRLRELIRGGEFGRVQYFDAVRTNLGPIRGDVNAFCDLGSHDVSIFNYLLGSAPTEVSAVGSCLTQETIEDVCFATLRYTDGTLAHIHAGWLSPRKVRTITVVGERQMATWDDVDPCDTLRVYDKGVATPPYYDSFGEFQYLLRSGDMHVPTVRRTQPLVNQARAFLDTVLDGAACISGGAEGTAVVAVLCAAQQSMRLGGSPCPVMGAALRSSVVLT